jgi:sucrose phosphorylase
MTGRARTINRAKLDMNDLVSQIENPETFRYKVFSAYRAMIEVRGAQPAFHPKAEFDVLEVDRRVFAIERHGGGQRLIALTNIASEDVTVDVGMLAAGPTRDLISKRVFAPGVVAMKPYDVLWLTPA